MFAKESDAKKDTFTCYEKPSTSRCCCSKVHVKTGSKLIGIFEFELFLVSMIGLVLAYINYANGMENPNSIFAPSFVCMLLWGSTIAGLFYGLKTNKADMLLPYLILKIVQIIGIAVCSILSVLLLWISEEVLIVVFKAINVDAIQYSSEDLESSFLYSAVTVVMLLSIIALTIQLWFFSVVQKCYRFFIETETQEATVLKKYTVSTVPVQNRLWTMTKLKHPLTTMREISFSSSSLDVLTLQGKKKVHFDI